MPPDNTLASVINLRPRSGMIDEWMYQSATSSFQNNVVINHSCETLPGTIDCTAEAEWAAGQPNYMRWSRVGMCWPLEGYPASDGRHGTNTMKFFTCEQTETRFLDTRLLPIQWVSFTSQTTWYKPVRRLLGDERAEVSVSCLSNWSLITHQIAVQPVQPFPRYGKGARTCERADVPHSWFMLTA